MVNPTEKILGILERENFDLLWRKIENMRGGWKNKKLEKRV